MTFDSMSSNINSNDTILGVQGFEADFTAVFEDGAGPHTHQISNFKPVRMDLSKAPAEEGINSTTHTNNILTPDGNAFILGTVDVE
jgi:hypothetical protein